MLLVVGLSLATETQWLIPKRTATGLTAQTPWGELCFIPHKTRLRDEVSGVGFVGIATINECPEGSSGTWVGEGHARFPWMREHEMCCVPRDECYIDRLCQGCMESFTNGSSLSTPATRERWKLPVPARVCETMCCNHADPVGPPFMQVSDQAAPAALLSLFSLILACAGFARNNERAVLARTRRRVRVLL